VTTIPLSYIYPRHIRRGNLHTARPVPRDSLERIAMDTDVSVVTQ